MRLPMLRLACAAGCALLLACAAGCVVVRDPPARPAQPSGPQPIAQHDQPTSDAQTQTRSAEPHDYRFAAMLAGRLRSSASDLGNWVSGPVLILDLETGLISTACGTRALAEARELGAQFVSPINSDPQCLENFVGLPAGDAFACATLNQDNVMHLVVIDHLADADHFRLRAAIVGHTNRDTLSLRQALGERLVTAACP